MKDFGFINTSCSCGKVNKAAGTGNQDFPRQKNDQELILNYSIQYPPISCNHINSDLIEFPWKNERQLEILIQTISIYSQDIGMEFGIEKCTMLRMKREKRETVERIELKIKKESEFLKRRKITSIWEYWKWTLSNFSKSHPKYK